MRGEGGQIVVEYVLLLVISIAIAFTITSTMVSRDPNDPGFLITKWEKIITMIGADEIDLVQ